MDLLWICWGVGAVIGMVAVQCEIWGVSPDPVLEMRIRKGVIAALIVLAWPVSMMLSAIYGLAIAVRAIGRWARWEVRQLRRGHDPKLPRARAIEQGPHRGGACEACGAPRRLP